jgi:hypothetical protein
MQNEIKAIGIMTPEYDTWINEEDLPSFTDEDIAWFRDEIGLSLDDLRRHLRRGEGDRTGFQAQR